jgi:ABC-type multidrug transport system permease subunit
MILTSAAIELCGLAAQGRQFIAGDTYMSTLVALLQQTPTNPEDLTLNWIILAVLLVIAAILGVIVVKRRMREQDDDYDI